jgi:hypothetical protein
MKKGGMATLTAGAALIALAAVLTPALAAPSSSKGRDSLSISRSGSFTPAVADPRLAAALAKRGHQPGAFRLTPASAESNKDKAVRVAVRARPNSAVPAVTSVRPGGSPVVGAITPSNYNLDAGVSWKRFSLTGGVERVANDTVAAERESARVGVAYSGRKIGGSVKVAAEQANGAERIVGVDSSYSVDVGASYSIARNINVTGGVRYKIQNDRLEALREQRRDSQAVYLGTSFRF